MSNRFFEPLKRIPQKIQNIGFVQKFQDKIYRPDEAINMKNTSSYGMMNDPSCLDFDSYLSLIAIGTKSGQIHVFGAPGIFFQIDAGESTIISIKFIPCEGRIIALSQDNCMMVFSLDVKTGKWLKTYSCQASITPNEYATCMTFCNDIIYVGFDTGNVQQYPTRDGKICVAPEEQRLVSFNKALADMTFEDRDELDLNCSIINIEVDRNGESLLIGCESGTIAIAKISKELPESVNGIEKKHSLDLDKKEAVTQSNTPSKLERSESNLLRKSRTMTMNLKNSFYGESKVKEILYEPFKVSVPPVPVVDHFFSMDQKITSASWYYPKDEENSIKVVSSYEDGSFRVWNYTKADSDSVQIIKTPENHNFPYGPMPCNRMDKILHSTSKNGESLRIFSGGLTKNIKSETSITIFKNASQFGFGFASKIIDFILVSSSKPQEVEQIDKQKVSSHPSEIEFLYVLTEKEFYIIDLTPKECMVLENPYLLCLDFSPITCVNYVENVGQDLIQSLAESNSLLDKDYIAYDKWPIIGGAGQISTDNKIFSKDNVLFLGHEDGCISMWQLDMGNCIRSLGVFFISDLYNTTQEIINDNWPFFKKIGMSQMYERIEMLNESLDSTCHAIKSIEITLRGDGHHLDAIIGSENGHVSVWSSESRPMLKFEPDVHLRQVDLASLDLSCNADNPTEFDDNTQGVLPRKEGPFTPSAIANKLMGPVKIFQMLPVSGINKVVYNPAWSILAIATDYGFALIDNESDKIIGSMFSPKNVTPMADSINGNPSESEGTNDAAAPSAKNKQNLKSSIRSSFKKMKKTKSPLKEDAKIEEETENGSTEKEIIASEVKTENGQSKEEKKETGEGAVVVAPSSEKKADKIKLYPAHVGWKIKSLLLTNGPLKSSEKSTPVLLVGTGCGKVLIYDIEKYFLDMNKSDDESMMILYKELHLQHGASIINLFMIDQKTHRCVDILSRDMMKLNVLHENSEEAENNNKKEESAKAETKPEVSASNEKKDDKASELVNEKKPEETKNDESSGKETKVEEKKVQEIVLDLLVISEEQVKIFNFSTLLAKQKYKFIDRTTRLASLGLSRQTSFSSASHLSKMDVDTSNGADASKQDLDISTTLSGDNSGVNSKKRIISASIKELANPQNPDILQHYIVLNLADSNVVIHSLPHLRRQAKMSTIQQNTLGHVSVSSLHGLNAYVCLSVVESSNSNSQLVATEFIREKYQFKALQTSVIQLPEWSRPNLATVITEALNKTLDSVNHQIVKPVEDSATSVKEKITLEVKKDIEKVSQVIEENIESGKKVIGEICSEMNDSLCKINGGDHSIGDITMDTVREYVQTDGIIKIKTSESSIEKRTTIKNGDISTLVRETEIVDGKVVKDDVIKMKTPSSIDEGEEDCEKITETSVNSNGRHEISTSN